MNEAGSRIKSDSMQYLTFILNGEPFALDILSTREVLMMEKITPIPETPDYLAGVINLRGSVVPVIDLGKKFRMPVQEKPNGSIIIAELTRNDEILTVGALVDGVRGVVRVEKSMLEPPPKVGMKLNSDLITGLARTENGFLIVLNVDRIFSEDDLERVNDSNAAPHRPVAPAEGS